MEEPQWLRGIGEGSVASSGRVRRARALVITYDGERAVVRNFLQKRAFDCPLPWIAALAAMGEWQTRPDAVRALDQLGFEMSEEQISRMLEAGGLVAEGSEEAARDDEYGQRWPWAETAGYFHFSTSREQFQDDEEEESWMVFRSITHQRPQAYTDHADGDAVIEAPGVDPTGPVFDTITERRSSRDFAGTPLTQEALFAVLHSGLAITAFADIPVAGKIPLKTAPSAGGRNPYEGFVYAVNVEGLERGVYHYSSLQRTLRRIDGDVAPASAMLGGQAWADKAGAIVLLVAYFDRAAYRYANPRGYRGVLVEAGHIAENMLLAATKLGVASVPIQAIDDESVERSLGLDPMTQAAMHAVVVGVPDPDAAFPWPVEKVT